MKIAYVLLNDFNLLSRAKRQVKTLKKNGYQVIIFQGSINNNRKNNSDDFYLLNIKETKFPLFNFFCLLKFNYDVFRLIISRKDIDYVICRELSTLFAGYLIKLFSNKIKLIYDSNELSVSTHTGIRRFVWFILEKEFVKKCDLIIHAEIKRKEYFNSIYKNLKAIQIVQPNYVEYNSFSNVKTENPSAIYIGAIMPHRNLEELISIFSKFGNIKLVLKGFGNSNYIDQLKKLVDNINNQSSNIFFEPPIEDEKLNDILKNYNIGIAFYPKTNLNNWYCAPNKVYQYIQNNLALITSNNPPLVDLIDEFNIGCYVDELTEDNLYKAIKNVLENKLWMNVNDEIKKRFSWENLEITFIDSIKQI